MRQKNHCWSGCENLAGEDYRLLVSTLDNLPKLEEKLISKKNEASSLRKAVTSQKKEVVRLREALERRDLDLREIDSEIENIEENISTIDIMNNDLELEVNDFKESKQHQLIEEGEIRDGKISRLKRKENILSFGLIIVICLFITYPLSSAYDHDRERYDDFLEEGFDCENGERIHGSLVLNDVQDCSNGHDEKDPWFSTSDAQDYDTDRWWSSIPWRSIIFLLFSILFFVSSISVMIGSVHGDRDSAINQFINKEKTLNLELARLDKKKKGLKSKRKGKVGHKKNLERKKKNILGLDRELRVCTKKLAELEGNSSICSNDVKSLKKQIEDEQNAISHLIPYSYLLNSD